ncbi:MAG: porin [Pseudomonadota bacterium]
MKKVLLGTSAIAAATAIAAPAYAADWDVRVGGFMEQHVVYSSVDSASGTDFDGVDVQSDTEIFFLPSITLDNGLKFGANIQLEGNTGGDQIDESYLFVKGSFGEINLGSENSAGYKMSYGAPDVSFYGINSGSHTAAVPFRGNDLFRGTLGSTFLENAGSIGGANGQNNDLQRITYYTPRFAGFQVGVSYARDGSEDNSARANCDAGGAAGNANCDYFDVAANYVNSFGDFDIAVSGRYGIASASATGAEDPEVYGFGLNLGFAGVTIGGSFGEQNGTAASDGTVFDAGISYETGPWGFSFTYIHGENHDNDNAAVVIGGQSANDETLDSYLLAATYSLAKGVKLGAYGAYVDFDEENGTAEDVDGFIIGTGIKLNF